MWTVDRAFDQPVKHRCFTSSAGDFLADLTLRVAPDLVQPGVRFESVWIVEGNNVPRLITAYPG
jgi:hypothetical protein